MGQSWSGIKKRLEDDLLCPALKGRVKYFVTKYRSSHDESGRVAILVDDKEMFQGNIFKYYKGYLEMEYKLKKERNIPNRYWNGKELVYNQENKEVEDYLEEVRLDDGNFDVWQFTDAVETYLNSSIESNLVSTNPLIRLLAILDRRVGKRRLIKIMDSLHNQPEWLQYFFLLRFQAEGLLR